MRRPRPSSLAAVGLCGALWVGGGAAVADAVTSSPAHVAAAPARSVAYDVELVVTPQTRYLNSKLTVDGHKTFFAPPNRVTKWKISFGDKQTKSGTSVKIPKLTHTYHKTGHYTAQLTVTDARGSVQTVKFGFSVVRKPVTKVSPAPVAEDSPSPSEAVKVSPIAAPSPSAPSPSPKPSPAASIDPNSPSPGASPSRSPSPSPSPTPMSPSPTCPVPLIMGLCQVAQTSPDPAGSGGDDLAALGLIGLAILSTPLAVATVRRRRA